jgi:hypothetical protein
MKQILKEVLHPEIVLDRRGTEKQTDLYKYLLPHCEYYEGKGWNSQLRNFGIDDTFESHVLMAKKFKKEKPKTYRLGKDFAEILAGVKNNIPVDRLPERFFGYVSVPTGVLRDDSGDIYGAYIYIGDAKETPAHPSLWGQRVLWMSIVGESPAADPEDFSVQHTLMELRGSFDEMYLSLKGLDTDMDAKSLEITTRETTEDLKAGRLNAARCFINTVLYVHSLEPNIDHLRPTNNMTNSERKKVGDPHINMCSVPVFAVNWGYKRMFSVEETFRREHPRWQRCGVGNADIKLIMVKGHIVRYSKGDSSELHEEQRSE